MGATHPALAPSAGLPSGLAHIAYNRWDPVKESSDYTEHFSELKSVKSQLPLPVPELTPAYSNDDIPFSHPTNRAILACNGLPRNFRTGSRCVNPLEPRYVLPGCSQPSSAAGTVQPSPVNPGTPAGGTPPRSASPVARRAGSERLLAPALSLPRGEPAPGTLTSPRLQPLPHSPSGGHTAAAAFGKNLQLQQAHYQPHPHQHQQRQHECSAQPQQHQLGTNAAVNINGAVGGLLLYGPTAHTNQTTIAAAAAAAATAAAAAAAVAAASSSNRSLDASDINGQRRCASMPLRRTGGFDPLSITDIVAPRRPSPTRPLACLTTSDIPGAAPRHRTRDVPSPGRGTLNSADVPGASPGCLTRASPTTYALGRWPAPAVPQYHFAHSTRVTVLKKPLIVAGE